MRLFRHLLYLFNLVDDVIKSESVGRLVLKYVRNSQLSSKAFVDTDAAHASFSKA